MSTRKTSAPNLRRRLRSGLLAIALVAVSGSLVAPAFADELRHDRGDQVRQSRNDESRNDERGRYVQHYAQHEERHSWDHERAAYFHGNIRHDEAPVYGYRYRYAAPVYAPAPVEHYAVPFLSFSFR
jgi:hypothetical protein